MTFLRIGNGFDVHPLVPGRPLMLGGVRIDHPLGLMGHSDGDVLVHAVIDALLGASSMGDIGKLFPDTDESLRGADSLDLLRKVGVKLRERDISIVNIDAVVICEKPKISKYTEEMKKAMAEALDGIDYERISIKGKTTEKLGFSGRGEGIAVYSVALVELGK